MNDKRPSQISSIMIINSEEVPLRVVLEPWADERVVAPHETVAISVDGPPGRLEIEHKSGELIVYGWEGVIMSIDDD